ncbi:hypothetical protein ColLi_04349 [Colletotrichum liriopes]|uniref:Uncharacterized protein n=1 Tax=Colletotrichum liriopes TaxID=708192 RepID=A0AA37GIA9_9PEZI|nr:hypothetical protein ColLi_04349 [Colletotrichum liriopes]
MPTPQSHPEFPLWELDYEPEELWDIFWPKGFQYVSLRYLVHRVCEELGASAPTPRCLWQRGALDQSVKSTGGNFEER